MKTGRIGQLRHRVRIERPVTRTDDGGGAVVTWQVLATVWAGITSTRGREVDFAHSRTARTTYDIVLRHRSDVDAAMRIVAGTRLFDIKSVRHVDDLHQWLVCECELRGP